MAKEKARVEKERLEKEEQERRDEISRKKREQEIVREQERLVDVKIRLCFTNH